MVATVFTGRYIPADVGAVRDDQGRIWHRGDDGRFHTFDGRHHHSAAELAARGDLAVAGDPVEFGVMPRG